MITKTRLCELFDYDSANGVLVRKVTAGGQKAGTVVGTADSYGYLQCSVDSRLYLVHRLVWLMVVGEYPQQELDHINGDRADNRAENLRLANRVQNTANRHKARSDSQTGKIGISFKKGKYIVRHQYEGIRKYIGAFSDMASAEIAYLQAKTATVGVFKIT